MVKPFQEALTDGFKHITTLTDPDLIKKLRSEGILIDTLGIYSFEFGDHKEYTLNVEPIAEIGTYRIILRKNQVALTESLYVKSL